MPQHMIKSWSLVLMRNDAKEPAMIMVSMLSLISASVSRGRSTLKDVSPSTARRCWRKSSWCVLRCLLSLMIVSKVLVILSLARRPLWNLVHGNLRGIASIASHIEVMSSCSISSSSPSSSPIKVPHIALNVIWRGGKTRKYVRKKHYGIMGWDWDSRRSSAGAWLHPLTGRWIFRNTT